MSSSILSLSSTPIQTGWDYLLDNFTHMQIDLGMTLLTQILTFWLPCLVYYCIEQYMPEFSAKHRIQPTVKTTRQELWYGLQVVFKNQLMNSFLHLALLVLSEKLERPSPFSWTHELPSVPTIVGQVVACHLMREVMFYYSHRFLHQPKYYARIHKLHHKFTAPVALAAQFAHPVEHLVANILPTAIPQQILHTHVIVNWIFVGSVLLETTLVHSGFDFFGNFAKKHDLHHEKFMIYFGVFGLLDWFHGTDEGRLSRKKNE